MYKKMLPNIKSSNFPKRIFTFIDERKKLKLVKYNKCLQKNINISIINYKFFSGKYVEYEANNIGKEYIGFNDELVFEGEYLHGERNGKGKEYDDKGILRFEGEYLNGKRNGKGKEYNEDGKLIFEGEYLNGYRNGKGKEFVDNGFFKFLRFEGEYLNGKRNGKGKEYNYTGIMKFEGEYLNGQKLIGTEYNDNGEIIFKLNNINANGIGKEYDEDGKLIFEGEYLNGYRHGKGKEYNYNYKKFEGEYFYGKMWNGKGYNSMNKVVYELKEGKGIIKEYDNNDKLIFEGEYLNGMKNGKGEEYHANGLLKFEGEYLNGKKNGKGKEYFFDRQLSFEGEYLYNKKLKGKFYINGKLEYEGEYLYERKYNGKGYDENGNIIYQLINGNGKVKEYDPYNSLLKFEGEYLNGKRSGN